MENADLKNTEFEDNEFEDNELLEFHGLSYTKKSRKLEDARSSSWLFIVFGIAGLLAIAAVWLGIIPLSMVLYMKILYTIVLGTLFLIFLILGIYYKKKIHVLESETRKEERLSKEIITFITTEYPLETLDTMISADKVPMEQLYFERYEKIASLIREKYLIQDEKYLDYLIEKIYQIYSPED